MGMQSTGSSTEKLLFPFSGLVVGISWLSIFLKFFIPVLTIDNKKLTYRKNLFRPNKVILISDLLSVTVKDKKLILAYKTKQQNTEKIVSFILKDFLQMDQEQLLNDIKMIFPASKLE